MTVTQPDQDPTLPDATAWLDAEALQAMGFEDLVPAPFAAWRPLIVEGLTRFLSALPPERLDEIIAAQLSLPADAAAAQRMVALLAQCPTLHKLGQVLARRRELDPDLRRRLQILESMPPRASLAPIIAEIRNEVGAAAPLDIATLALAEGSVAVVVPFSWREGGKDREGVFKVLKPGIEAKLASELALLPDIAAFLDQRSAGLGLPVPDFSGTLASIQQLLEMEVRLDVEQDNMRRAQAFYRNDPGVFVPELLPWCTPRITAMERVSGPKVSDASLSPAEREVIGRRMIASLLAKPFWSREEQAIFHGDLHGGNLLLAADGRLAVIDWSLTASLSKAEREALVALAMSGLTLDAPQIQDALGRLGLANPCDPDLAAVVERSLDDLVRSGRTVSFAWLVRLLDELALRGAKGFGAQLSVFRKSWLALSGVIDDLGASGAADLPLLGVGLQRFLIELPARMIARADSRAFATHVSNADLVRLSLSSWVTGIRYWSRIVGNTMAAAG